MTGDNTSAADAERAPRAKGMEASVTFSNTAKCFHERSIEKSILKAILVLIYQVYIQDLQSCINISALLSGQYEDMYSGRFHRQQLPDIQEEDSYHAASPAAAIAPAAPFAQYPNPAFRGHNRKHSKPRLGKRPDVPPMIDILAAITDDLMQRAYYDHRAHVLAPDTDEGPSNAGKSHAHSSCTKIHDAGQCIDDRWSRQLSVTAPAAYIMRILVPAMNEQANFSKTSHEENRRRGLIYLQNFEHCVKGSTRHLTQYQVAEGAHAHALFMVRESAGISYSFEKVEADLSKDQSKTDHQPLVEEAVLTLPNIDRHTRTNALLTPPQSPSKLRVTLTKPVEALTVVPIKAGTAHATESKQILPIPTEPEQNLIVHLKDSAGRRRHRPLSISPSELPMSQRCVHLLTDDVCNEGTCYVLDVAAYAVVNIFGSKLVTTKTISWNRNLAVQFERPYICLNDNCKGHRYPAGPRCWTSAGLYLIDDIKACMKVLIDGPGHHFVPMDQPSQERLVKTLMVHFDENAFTRGDTYFYQPYEYALHGLEVTSWKRKGALWDQVKSLWVGGEQEVNDWKEERMMMMEPEMKRYFCYLARKEFEFQESGGDAAHVCDAARYFKAEYEE